MAFTVRLGVVADPSQVARIAKLAASGNEKTAEVSWTDETWLDREGEHQDQPDQDHRLAEQEAGVTLADTVAVPSGREGKNAADDVTGVSDALQ